MVPISQFVRWIWRIVPFACGALVTASLLTTAPASATSCSGPVTEFRTYEFVSLQQGTGDPSPTNSTVFPSRISLTGSESGDDSQAFLLVDGTLLTLVRDE